MDLNVFKTEKWKELAVIALLALAGLTLTVHGVESRSFDPTGDGQQQMSYKSPEEAGVTLAAAAKTEDATALTRVLGPEMKTLLISGETQSDKEALDAFASKYQEMNRWVSMNDGSEVLYIGSDNFEFPAPLVKNSSGEWYFDGVAGAEELRAREIGRNELLAIDACLSLANAEEIYFNLNEDAPGFAQRIISTSGKQDGLYWPASNTQNASPLGDLSQLPKSSLASYSGDQPLVIDGYSLRVLTSQGPDAPGGAISYMVEGKMIGGFAILATPVKYGETGIMTFIISQEGIVYERDFGPDTVKLAGAIQDYNPDDNWSGVE